MDQIPKEDDTTAVMQTTFISLGKKRNQYYMESYCELFGFPSGSSSEAESYVMGSSIIKLHHMTQNSLFHNSIKKKAVTMEFYPPIAQQNISPHSTLKGC